MPSQPSTVVGTSSPVVAHRHGAAERMRLRRRRARRFERRFLRQNGTRECESDDDAARAREEVTARDHALSPAALLIARTMRRCVPQRQRLPSRAAAI
jgi:hypothetical protein